MLALDGRAGPRTHRITCPAPTLEEGGSAMVRAAALGCALLLTIGLMPVAAHAQTKEDTLVYALQSDIDTGDPPGSVLREAIILGYHVFDHLAVRDLKTRKVIPNLAISWKTIDDTTWEVKLRQGVKFHDGTPFTSKDVKATFDRVLDPVKKMIARQPRQDQDRGDRGRLHRALQDRRPLPAPRGAHDGSGDGVREGHPREGRRVDAGASRGHRALQARQVVTQAGAPARPQR